MISKGKRTPNMVAPVDLATIECEDLETGERTEVLCAMELEPDGSVKVLPLAILSVVSDNPTTG